MSESTLAVVGSYTQEGGDGLSTYRVTGGSLTSCDSAYEENPSFVDSHPTEDIFLAVNEREDGSAVSYRVDRRDGSLHRLDSTETGGAGPCHVAVGPRGEYAVVSHYDGGSVGLLSVAPDGSLAGPLHVREHEGTGPNTDRQTAPHPHSAWFVTDSLVYVPDLGADRVVVYELDRNAERLDPLPDASFDCPPGSGPRHIAFHPSEPVGYLVNELRPSLSVLDLSEPERPAIDQTHSTLPAAADPTETIAADVHVHPAGTHVTVSNRGHDSLATFAAEQSPLDLVRTDVTETGGTCPRNFAIHPDGTRIYVCHLQSDDITPFTVDPKTGGPDRAETRIKVGAPACLHFM
ncbi:lactonase family protein [Halorubrum sp. CSM-61]|uniref:lactonase family protein n=1 Tax=Halorubrum sp. CSM-61 TaxID=2485838 RepID=UPI000F4AF77E|nr:lactonase family protein [Halorubrum sp. CSM-61]